MKSFKICDLKKTLFIIKYGRYPVIHNSSRVRSINQKLLYLRSTWPSSSNRLNAWMLFGLSIYTMTSWSWKCWLSHFSFIYLLRRFYCRYVICHIMILSVDRSCVLSHNYDNLVFIEISRMIEITCSKMGDDVFTSL